MVDVGCVGRALARVWAGVCGCIGECGGSTLLWLNSKLMSKISNEKIKVHLMGREIQ
jgi:NADH:ubiquinone oxidoreductase subunit E